MRAKLGLLGVESRLKKKDPRNANVRHNFVNAFA